jgi:hypothetical protein
MPKTPDESRIVPLPIPFADLPPPGERLTEVRFGDVMRMLLEQSYGLAGVCYAAAASREGAPRSLPDALFVLEAYTGAALDLWACWREQQRHDDRPAPDTEAHDAQAE